MTPVLIGVGLGVALAIARRRRARRTHAAPVTADWTPDAPTHGRDPETGHVERGWLR